MKADVKHDVHTGLLQLTPTRFVAALTVVFYHLGGGIPGISGEPWSPLLMIGPIAVSYFYTLSGFIMATVYYDLDRRGMVAFWMARFARIYPLYAVALIWFIYYYPWNWTDLISNLTLTQAWIPGHALSLNGVGWSLSVEAFFYAAFPAFILAARRFGAKIWLLITIFIWIATQVTVHRLNIALAPQYPSAQHDFVSYFPLWHVNSFMLGIAAAILTRCISLPYPRLIAMASILAIGFFLLHIRMLMTLGELTLSPEEGGMAPLFALLIAAITQANLPFLRNRFAVFLGEASYAVYLLHISIAEAVERFISHGPLTTSTFWLTISCTLFLACLAYFAIENPLRLAIVNSYRSLRTVGIATSPQKNYENTDLVEEPLSPAPTTPV